MRVLSDVGFLEIQSDGSILKYTILILFCVFLKALKLNNYDAEPLLKSCGISINSNFTQVEGRVLPAPRVLLSFDFRIWTYSFV